MRELLKSWWIMRQICERPSLNGCVPLPGLSVTLDHQPVARHFELRLDDRTNRYISGRFESILTSGLRNSDDTRFA